MKSNKILLIGAIFTTLTVAGSAEKILFLLPLASRSHVNVFEPLMRTLGERGHNVVALSPLTSPNMPATVKQIQLITVEDLTGKMPNVFDQRRQILQPFGFMRLMMNSSSFDHMNKACLKVLQHPKLNEILEEKFDLVIVDLFLNYCALGMIPPGTPTIQVSTIAAPSFISNIAGNRLPQSFVPNAFLQYSDKMSFKDRMINTVMDFFSATTWHLFIESPAEKMYKENLPNGDKLPSLQEILANTSMIFMNSHFTLTYPRPLLPDVIEVGGMHTRAPKELPKDLDDFLTGSGEDGFIFFSLGSIVKPTEMPEETRKVFIKVFSKLKQRVLWKWGSETMPDAPPNVMLRKWLPQQDILGHPNIKLFMSHGGLLSTQESVYHGVPVLGLPIFGDQDLNIKQAEKGGYAKFVELIDLTEEQLEEAIVELISNPKYTQKVKNLSKLVKDLPHTSLEKAVFWTEYILRHKDNLGHLRSAARDLNFFQYYLLDVTAALLALVAVILYLTIKCCKAVFRCVCGSKGKKVHFKKD